MNRNVATQPCHYDFERGIYASSTPAVDSQCRDGEGCLGDAQCSLVQYWSTECGGCTCQAVGGICVPSASCPSSLSLAGPPKDPETSQTWSDCDSNQGYVCCDLNDIENCADLNLENAVCLNPSQCQSSNGEPIAPAKSWTDCASYAGDVCCLLPETGTDTQPQQPTGGSCAASGGFCAPISECSQQLSRPDNGWQEEDCKLENSGTCCSVEQYLTPGCEYAGDCHRDYIGCYRGELKRTKEWSRTFTTREEAELWLENFNVTTTYSYDGTMTLEDLTFPIDGELERLVGYFPYGDPDGDGPAPDVINGPQDLKKHDFVEGPLFRLAPPENAAEIANWLPAMFKNYKHYAVRLKYCGNNRTPEDDDTNDQGNPEIHGGVRGPWGLLQSMHNDVLDAGLWTWIARKPGQSAAEAINETKALTATKLDTNNKAEIAPQVTYPLATAASLEEGNHYALLTQANTYSDIGNVLGKITCPEVQSCPRDGRSAPQYDEDCVRYGGNVEVRSQFTNITVTKENSDTRIDTNIDGPVVTHTAHLSHTESIEMNTEVRECHLAEYWPLKLNFFLSLIPPQITSGSGPQNLTTSPENLWGRLELDHSDPNVQVDVGNENIGKEVEYMHLAGWAKTAEELVMGKDTRVLGTSTSKTQNTGSSTGEVLSSSTPMQTGLGYAIPPSWGGVYLPIILKGYEDYLEESVPPGSYAEGPDSIPNPEALAAQVEDWADSLWGEGAGDRFIYLALTQGETGMGANCGTCIAWEEYRKHPALDTDSQRSALRTLNEFWKKHDIRSNPESFASQYIPDSYSVQGIKGSCGGGALGLSQLLAGTAVLHLNKHGLGEPFDLWEPETAMKVMAAELHRLGWHRDLTWTQKLNVLRKWNNKDWWLQQVLQTAKQYMNYRSSH
ncbi:MAG: hypothetical protein U9M98_00610 [Patescibacteria group bacterium]|nr:hypothetical protein [Patescibacteria group bacterium]